MTRADTVRRSTRARPTDDELLDAARAVFADQGFTNTTMSAIAARSNSTKPTLYAHFGDKDALYRTLLDRETDVCRRLLFQAYARNADLDLREQVTADTEAFFDYVRANPEGFALLYGGDLTGAATEARERLTADVHEQITGRLHQYLVRHGMTSAAARPSRDEQQLAALLVGVAVNSARHATETGQSLTRACRIASAFSTAALLHLELP